VDEKSVLGLVFIDVGRGIVLFKPDEHEVGWAYRVGHLRAEPMIL
jgi:hypothetical protein